jgi:phosphoribosylglycinamide formyltransferase 1
VSSGDKINLAIFASGAGSNANQICIYFKDHPSIKVKLIVTNKKEAGVFHVGEQHGIETVYISKTVWQNEEEVISLLRAKNISHIVLAGFLLLCPGWLVSHYRGRIINIHPALLPKYGGKGMYGMNVHQKVKEEGDLVSGITIHNVDEHYDEGDVIFQEKVYLDGNESPGEIADKVLRLEHYHYPRVIERWALCEL